MNNYLIRRTFISFLTLFAAVNNAESQTSLIWGIQFGSDKEEYAYNHLTDSKGNVYVAGNTAGIMDGKNYGKNDGFLSKIDSQGNTIWTKQFGSAGDENIQWSAIDDSGFIYVTGTTTGVLDNKNFGKEDLFIAKYNPEGILEWMKQFGSDSTDLPKGICTDLKGDIYVTGMTAGKLGQNSFGKTDCFIMMLDNGGNKLFTVQFGTAGDDCSYSITDGSDSDIYVCGTTWGDLGGKNKGFIDGFTGHFTGNGNLIGYYQFGSEGFDIAMILTADNQKNIYVGGSTSGNFGGKQNGEGDAFLLKLNEKGEIIWNDQFGTVKNDGVRSIDINPEISDNILVSGIINLPPARGFIRMFNRDGVLLWERNFAADEKGLGTSGKTAGFDSKGNFYHMGLTGANLFGKLTGETDVYLVKMALDESFKRH